MKVCSSPRIAPTSATDRNDGMRLAYTCVGRPRTSSVTTSNIPPGPVSSARTSAAVGIRGVLPPLNSDIYCPGYADERGGGVVDPLLHRAGRAARGAGAPGGPPG